MKYVYSYSYTASSIKIPPVPVPGFVPVPALAVSLLQPQAFPPFLVSFFFSTSDTILPCKLAFCQYFLINFTFKGIVNGIKKKCLF